MSGRKLNLSVCDKDITVMKYIGDIKELDIESAMNLADKGIDVFNPNDNYFNDICQDYDNSDGKDIIIKDRRADKFQNATFCQEGCTYDGINVELKTANCKCDSNLIQNDLENDDIESNNNNKEEKLNFDTLTESFLTSLLDFNINPFYCYNLVFNIKIFKNNIGFYFMFIISVIKLILFFAYLIKKVKPLRYFMLIFSNKKNQPEIKAFPPKNNTNLNLINLYFHIYLKNHFPHLIIEVFLYFYNYFHYFFRLLLKCNFPLFYFLNYFYFHLIQIYSI